MATSDTERPTRLAAMFLAISILAFFGVGFAVFASQLHRPQQIGVNPRALYYAQHQMVWMSGPTVVTSYVLPMRELPRALRLYVPRKVARDVNTADLIRRYGANLQIGMVVLRGVFNTLPPDEGVVVHGDVVVLVDVKHDRGLFLTY
jgi:hypothetical protein